LSANGFFYPKRNSGLGVWRPRYNGHLDVGMHVIAKPFNMSEFAGKVREMIDA
jgi:hypothetical protein